MFSPDSAFLFYTFQILYMGYPAIFAQRMMEGKKMADEDGRTHMLDGLGETFKSVGMMSALLAAAASALLVFPPAIEHPVVQYLLLTSLVCSLLSAKVSVDLISGLSFASEKEFAEAWDRLGIKWAILLCTPAAWIHFAIYAFMAALFAIAWYLNHQVAVPAVVAITCILLLLNHTVRLLVKGFEDPFGVAVLKDIQSDHATTKAVNNV